MFLLVDVIVLVCRRAVDHVLGLTWGSGGSHGFFRSFYALVVALPTIGVQIRRLHDIGKSGWFLLAACIPVLGAFLLLYWYIQDSDSGENAYGPRPSAVAGAA